MRKLTILVAGGIGYVLGTRAGRERYDQIRGLAEQVKNNPKVQEKAHQAADAAREHAPAVKDKLTDAAGTAANAAGTAASKVKPSGSSDTADRLNPDSTARQDDPYPQGNLP
jgi:hypothetical protein